jgi:hypothetical protein
MVNADLRERMLAVRARAEKEGEAAREGWVGMDILLDFYQGLNDEERRLANEVIRDWLVSPDEGARFEALVMVSKFEIRQLVPALKALVEMLTLSSGPGARYERQAVERTIAELCQSPGGDQSR